MEACLKLAVKVLNKTMDSTTPTPEKMEFTTITRVNGKASSFQFYRIFGQRTSAAWGSLVTETFEVPDYRSNRAGCFLPKDGESERVPYRGDEQEPAKAVFLFSINM